jgi:hypothetical protein
MTDIAPVIFNPTTGLPELNPALPTLSSTPSHTTGNPAGWHLVKFANGSAAIVAAGTNGVLNWGNVAAPASPITSTTYLGSNLAAIGNHPKVLENALAGLPKKVRLGITDVVSEGSSTGSQQPVLIDKDGNTHGTAKITGSAQPVDPGTPTEPSVPDPLAALASIWSAVTDPANWLRALELFGGAVAVFMALKALTGVSVPSINLPAAAVAA